VIERNSLYTGIHATAQVLLLMLESDGEYLYLRPLREVVVCVSNYSISNSLWLKSDTLILPDPLNSGREPSLLTFDAKARSCSLSNEYSRFGLPDYDCKPSGLLTALQNGYACFVRYCDVTEPKAGAGSCSYLGEHEHHIITVLDDHQQRTFEIAIPGLVVEITSHEDAVCFLYRNHVAVELRGAENSMPIVSPDVLNCRQPAGTKKEYATTGLNRHSFGGIRESDSGEVLVYRSYPCLEQPWLRRELRPPERRVFPSQCPLKTGKIFSIDKIERSFAQTGSVLCRQTYSKYLLSYSNPTDPDYPIEAECFSSMSDSDTNSDSDGSNIAEPASERTAEPKKKRYRLSEPAPPTSTSGLSADAVEGRFYAPVYDVKEHPFYYAEVCTKRKEVIFFSGEKLNTQELRRDIYGMAFAHEATDDPPENAPHLNKVLLLGHAAKHNNLSINKSCVTIGQQSIGAQGSRGRLILSRNHSNLPVLKERNSATFVTQDYEQTWMTSSKDRLSGFTGLKIRSTNPGRDEKNATASYRLRPPVSPLKITQTSKKQT
jgi:hypothetical protein